MDSIANGPPDLEYSPVLPPTESQSAELPDFYLYLSDEDDPKAALSHARTDIEQRLHEWGADEMVALGGATVLSELAQNAAKHAGGWVAAWVVRTETGATIFVQDRSDTPVATTVEIPDDPLEQLGGRGLTTVFKGFGVARRGQFLVDSDECPNGKVVWAEILFGESDTIAASAPDDRQERVSRISGHTLMDYVVGRLGTIQTQSDSH